MSKRDELTADVLLHSRRLRYVATGDTYPHRDELTSWGWHWNASRKAWVEESGSDPDDICIEAIRHLPGVVVTEEARP